MVKVIRTETIISEIELSGDEFTSEDGELDASQALGAAVATDAWAEPTRTVNYEVHSEEEECKISHFSRRA